MPKIDSCPKKAKVSTIFGLFQTLIRTIILICQELVRFCADYRIKPHAPPLVLDPRQFL